MFGLVWAYHNLLSGKLGSRVGSGQASMMTQPLMLRPVVSS